MGALFLKNATVTVGGVEASDDVDNVTFTPTTNTATWNPISGKTQQETSEPSWACAFNLAQNYEADSLFMKLYERTEEMEVVFKPRGSAIGPTITAMVMPAPASIGGGVGVLTSSATLACNGKPTIAPAVPPEDPVIPPEGV